MPDDVVGRALVLLDDLRQVLADAVERHAAVDGDAGLRHVGELDRVVGVRPDRVGEVDADLALDDVERRHDFDVVDVVAAEVRRASGRGRTRRPSRPCSRSSPCMNEFAQLPTPMIATRTLSCCRPRFEPFISLTIRFPPMSCLRTCRTRWPTVIHAVQARSTSAQGSTPQGARTSPAVMTTTRSAREPMPTSPRRPRFSAFARV